MLTFCSLWRIAKVVGFSKDTRSDVLSRALMVAVIFCREWILRKFVATH